MRQRTPPLPLWRSRLFFASPAVQLARFQYFGHPDFPVDKRRRNSGHVILVSGFFGGRAHMKVHRWVLIRQQQE